MRMLRTKYTKQLLGPIVEQCRSWAEVCRKLEVSSRTGAQSYIAKVAKAYDLPTTHFTGKAWNKGKTFPHKQPIEKYLVANSPCNSNYIKKRLIKEGFKKQECELCGLTDWQGAPAILELDHINSDHFDNRLENLQLLCPNCHAMETRRRLVDRREQKMPPKPTRTKKEKIKGDPHWRTKPKPSFRKVVRPEKDELQRLIRTASFVQIGKTFGVSDNAVRKWCRSYGISLNARVLKLVDNSVLEADAK